MLSCRRQKVTYVTSIIVNVVVNLLLLMVAQYCDWLTFIRSVYVAIWQPERR